MSTVRKKISLFKRKRGNYKRKKTFNYIKDELQNATTHGLSYFVNDRIYLFERIFWLASFVVSLAFIFSLLSAQYLRFIEAPTVVSVDMDYFGWNISFPAITLCPLYKADVDKYRKVLNDKLNETGIEANEYLWAILHANIASLEFVKIDIPDETVSAFDPKDYAKTAAAVFRGLYLDSMETKINQRLEIIPAMTEMGMCHVLNSNIAIFDQPNKWNSINSENYTKSNIELSVYDRDFFLQISDYAKIYKVYIHSPDEIITGTTSSFTFDAEGLVSFGLSVGTTRISDELEVMPLRIRKCRFINEPISDRYPVYSYSHCLLECRIKLIKRLCGCIPHFYKPLAHERICHIRELKCVLHYRKDITTLSPSEATFKLPNTKGLPKNSRDCGCLSTCELDQYHKDKEEHFRYIANIVEIRITSFPKVRMVRDIIFNFYDILLRSGGVVNLCIGSSLISIAELLVIFTKVSIYSIYTKLFG